MKDAKGHGSNGRGGIGAQGMRKLKTHTNGPHSANVYNNPEWGEKVVKFFQNGVYQPKADYHTDDLDDAHATAKAGLSRYAALDNSTAAKTISSGPAAPVHDAQANYDANLRKNLDAFKAAYGGPRDHAAEARSFASGKREINRLKRSGR